MTNEALLRLFQNPWLAPGWCYVFTPNRAKQYLGWHKAILWKPLGNLPWLPKFDAKAGSNKRGVRTIEAASQLETFREISLEKVPFRLTGSHEQPLLNICVFALLVTFIPALKGLPGRRGSSHFVTNNKLFCCCIVPIAFFI